MSNTLSKNLEKTIKSLNSKKGRTKSGLFLAEGSKLIADMLRAEHYALFKLVTTKELSPLFDVPEEKLILGTADDIKKVSLQKSPQSALALFHFPEQSLESNLDLDGLTICLDGLQDPGNLGTIVRTCSWYSIKNIVCSVDTADIYNPKAIQASMGGLCNVNVYYTDLLGFIDKCKNLGVHVATTQMQGQDLHKTKVPESLILILGNEGKGVSEALSKAASSKLAILPFHKGVGAESLNVSIANAIFCHEYRRQHHN
ncbi:MAG: TrmH family RNA methyltransferase [Bacteroidales bacterium]